MVAIFKKLQDITELSAIFSSTEEVAGDFTNLMENINTTKNNYNDTIAELLNLNFSFYKLHQEIKTQIKPPGQCDIPEVSKFSTFVSPASYCTDTQ